MVNLIWIRLTVLFTALISLSVPVSASAPVRSQTQTVTPQTPFLAQNNAPPKSRSGGSRLRNNPPPARGQGGSRSWEQTLSDVLLNNEPPKSRDGGSRGGFCAIAPMDMETGVKLWNDRPIFVWQGSLMRLELRNHNGETLIWSQTVSKADHTARYTGEPLQPGEMYTLWLYTSQSYIPDYQVIFQLLSSEQQAEIRQDLQQLETTLKQDNGTTEAIAKARFQYFAQKQLWSDAVSEPFLVQNPSPSLSQFKMEILPKQFCHSSSDS